MPKKNSQSAIRSLTGKEGKTIFGRIEKGVEAAGVMGLAANTAKLLDQMKEMLAGFHSHSAEFSAADSLTVIAVCASLCCDHNAKQNRRLWNQMIPLVRVFFSYFTSPIEIYTNGLDNASDENMFFKKLLMDLNQFVPTILPERVVQALKSETMREQANIKFFNNLFFILDRMFFDYDSCRLDGVIAFCSVIKRIKYNPIFKDLFFVRLVLITLESLFKKGLFDYCKLVKMEGLYQPNYHVYLRQLYQNSSKSAFSYNKFDESIGFINSIDQSFFKKNHLLSYYDLLMFELKSFVQALPDIFKKTGEQYGEIELKYEVIRKIIALQKETVFFPAMFSQVNVGCLGDDRCAKELLKEDQQEVACRARKREAKLKHKNKEKNKKIELKNKKKLEQKNSEEEKKIKENLAIINNYSTELSFYLNQYHNYIDDFLGKNIKECFNLFVKKQQTISSTEGQLMVKIDQVYELIADQAIPCSRREKMELILEKIQSSLPTFSFDQKLKLSFDTLNADIVKLTEKIKVNVETIYEAIMHSGCYFSEEAWLSKQQLVSLQQKKAQLTSFFDQFRVPQGWLHQLIGLGFNINRELIEDLNIKLSDLACILTNLNQLIAACEGATQHASALIQLGMFKPTTALSGGNNHVAACWRLREQLVSKLYSNLSGIPRLAQLTGEQGRNGFSAAHTSVLDSLRSSVQQLAGTITISVEPYIKKFPERKDCFLIFLKEVKQFDQELKLAIDQALAQIPDYEGQTGEAKEKHLSDKKKKLIFVRLTIAFENTAHALSEGMLKRITMLKHLNDTLCAEVFDAVAVDTVQRQLFAQRQQTSQLDNKLAELNEKLTVFFTEDGSLQPDFIPIHMLPIFVPVIPPVITVSDPSRFFTLPRIAYLAEESSVVHEAVGNG